MKRIIKLIIFIAVIVKLNFTAFSAPLFSDTDSSHWAYEACRVLMEKNILKGYPDNKFKGDRKITRNEFAGVIDNFLNYLETNKNFFTLKDKEEIKNFIESYKKSYDTSNKKQDEFAEKLEEVFNRINSLGKTWYSGSFHQMLGINSVRGDNSNIGTASNPNSADYTSGILLLRGKYVGSLLDFNVFQNIVDKYILHLKFGGFAGGEDLAFGKYWGITPPYSCNPYTTPPYNSTFSKMRFVIDRVEFSPVPETWKLAWGSFNPVYNEKFLFNGQRNPQAGFPSILPLFGFTTNGFFLLKFGMVGYEFLYSQIPQNTNYNTQTFGGSAVLSTQIKKMPFRISLSYYRLFNGQENGGIVNQAGLIGLPVNIFWRSPGSTSTSSLVGPQKEDLIGLRTKLDVSKNLIIDASIGKSYYTPDLSGALFRGRTIGNIYKIKADYQTKAFKTWLEYKKIAPNYDSFILRYPQDVNSPLPIFLPFSSVYTNYYQIHDYINYPNNRQGYTFGMDYYFNKYNDLLTLSHQDLKQVIPSTPAYMTEMGYVEPVFNQLTQGGSESGGVRSDYVYLQHKFSTTKNINLSFSQYKILRDAAGADNLSTVQRTYSFWFNQYIKNDLLLNLGYDYIKYSGLYNNGQVGYQQNIPHIALTYFKEQQTERVQTVKLRYDYYKYDNFIQNNSNWYAHKLVCEYELKF